MIYAEMFQHEDIYNNSVMGQNINDNTAIFNGFDHVIISLFYFFINVISPVFPWSYKEFSYDR